MHKGIKILAKVLSIIILLSIFLPISITLVLNVGTVQNAVVSRAASFASDILGTRVSIDRVDLDLFSRVRVEGFYVEDYEQDTLLYVSRARATISSLNIKRNGLCISQASAEDGCFCIREMSDGELNIRPIVAHLQNPNAKGTFRLSIDNIDAKNVEFRYERLVHRDPEYGIDYFDMQILAKEANVRNLGVAKGSVWLEVASLEAVERSGFRIDNISTHIRVDKGVISFGEFMATTETSSIYLPTMKIVGEDWLCYKDFIDEVRMEGRIENTTISTYDLGYFAPGLRGWDTYIRDAEATFEGVVRDLKGHLVRATIADGSAACGTFRIVGLPDWRAARYVVSLERLYAASKDVECLTSNILPQPLPEGVLSIVRRAQGADVRATFGGRFDAFRVVGNIYTPCGDLSGDISIRRNPEARYDIHGTANTKNLNLGGLLAVKNLHALSSDLALSGSMGSKASGGIIGDVNITVDGLGFGDYLYSGIAGVGHIEGDNYYAEVTSSDENFEFDLFANVGLGREKPAYALSMDVHRADLHALGFNKRDTLSVVSANIGLDLIGENVEDMDGYVSIADATYLYPDGELSSDLVRLEVDGNDRQKAVMLTSDFFDLSYHSHSTYREVYDYLYNSLTTYVPLLYDNGTQIVVNDGTVNNPNDYTALTLQAGDSINEFLDAVAGGLVMAPNTELGLIFNHKSNNLSLRGSSEALEYSGLIMANVEWNVNNNSRDSLSMLVKSEGVYLGSRMLMPKLNLVGGARENRIAITAGFKQDDGTSSAMLGLTAQFSRNEHSRRRSMHIDITPSHFTTSTQQWKLFSQGIDIDSTRISIKNLRIARPDQQLIIDGVASRQRSDSIRITLNNFDLSPLSALTSKWGYSARSISNGYATIKSALNNPEIEAQISLDDISVNEIKVPPQEITSKWDFKANRAHVIFRDRNSLDTVIRGYYQPQGTRYFAEARMRNVKIALIAPFLKDIISDIEGDANIKAQIIGQGRKATLSGAATVDSLGATVDYTKVRYTAPYAELKIENNHIIARDVPVYDPEHNRGHFSMDINLERLSNIIYNIEIDANKMLVLDTGVKDNDLFYGHVYGSGNASFVGDKLGIKMDIEATSAENSKFFMPLSGKEDVLYADFVKFKESESSLPDTTAFLTRRMMAYERKNRPVNTSGGVMDMDMTLNVLPNIEMQLVIDPTVGDIIKGKGSGQLNMHIVPKANIFEMRGDVVISEGTYLFTLQNILNKLFTVVPGSSIHWTGDPMGAILNIDAVYSTKASLRPLLGGSVQGIDTSRAVPVDCYIKLTDELMSPVVTFDVKVPNVAPEIQTVIQSTLNDQQAIATQMFWLLAANTFSAEDTSSMGASLSATTGFELLSNQLSNWLSGDNYNIILRYRPRTEMSGDEVDFGFSKSWLDDRLIVELEGGYLSDASVQATKNASNFVGEAFITWLIDPDGTLRFRGFTQTIDRYGENQGMQEAGVGIYYSESFNTFKDLGQSIRNRFMHRDSLGRVLSRTEYREMKETERAKRKEQRRDNKRHDDTLGKRGDATQRKEEEN